MALDQNWRESRREEERMRRKKKAAGMSQTSFSLYLHNQ